jgi:hypothetical protein
MKAEHFSITKRNWLILFREIISVQAENDRTFLNMIWGQRVDLLTIKDVVRNITCVL